MQRLEAQAAAPDFWNNQEEAQKILQQRARLERAINTAEVQRRLVDDIAVLFEFAAEDDASARELRESLERLADEVEESETRMLLGGENDSLNAIVAINAGAGGTDAQDWAEMLLRMYLRWCERHDFKTEMFDYQAGEEAGIKSASFRVEGDYAYGLLAGEVGVHRLVRISPFNAGQSRETSFASVFVTPEFDDNIEVEIQDKDLRVDTYRSTGAGGQHINTTDSAVRITHLPTGIVVSCQNEKSQLQNREQAMRILRARLLAAAQEQADAAASDVRRSQVRTVDRSERIRTYNFPQNRITDHRIGFTAYNLDLVLAGDLDGVLDALAEADRQARLAGETELTRR